MNLTLEDLTAERRAAKAAIESFQGIATAWAFEATPASSKPLRDAYIDEVKTSDALVLIVGRVLTTPTIDEYNTAIERRIPILVFVKELEGRLPEALGFMEALDLKYAKFSEPLSLQKEISRAIANEIVNRAKSFKPLGSTGHRLKGTGSCEKLDSTSLSTLILKYLVSSECVDFELFHAFRSPSVRALVQPPRVGIALPVRLILY
jgi:hypothetical protein